MKSIISVSSSLIPINILSCLPFLVEAYMENADRELIKKVLKSNLKLKRLYEEHQFLEHKLSGFQHRPFLTAGEQLELQRLKKRKLFGVDRMMEILVAHRTVAA